MQLLPGNYERPDWLAARRLGLGGTDVAALLGIHPYKTRLGVYLDKTTLDEPDEDDDDDDSPSEAAYWGTALEPIVADHFARENKLTLAKPGMWGRGVDGDRWQLASPDRLVYTDSPLLLQPDGSLQPGAAVCPPATVEDVLAAEALYEGKTASAYLRDEWKDNLVPDHYVVQTQWYLHVMGLQWAWIAALLGGQRYVQVRIERDQPLIDNLVTIAARFWHDNVLAEIPPELAGEPTRAALALLDQLFPVSVEGEGVDLDPAFTQILADFEEAKRLERAYKARADEFKVLIREALGSAEVGLIGGQPAIRAKNVAASSYTVNRKPSRRLTLDKDFKQALTELTEGTDDGGNE